jgi:hypothetical protein
MILEVNGHLFKCRSLGTRSTAFWLGVTGMRTRSKVLVMRFWCRPRWVRLENPYRVQDGGW